MSTMNRPPPGPRRLSYGTPRPLRRSSPSEPCSLLLRYYEAPPNTPSRLPHSASFQGNALYSPQQSRKTSLPSFNTRNESTPSPMCGTPEVERIAWLEQELQRLSQQNKALTAKLISLDRNKGQMVSKTTRDRTSRSSERGSICCSNSCLNLPSLPASPCYIRVLNGDGDLDIGMPLRSNSLSNERLDGKTTLSGAGASPCTTNGVHMRHDSAFRRGSLNSRGSGGPGASSRAMDSPRPQRPLTVNYELSDDIRAKEIELTEKRYGGRFRSQRAARVIQSTFREYRRRLEYDRIRTDKRTSRRLDSISRSTSIRDEPKPELRLPRQTSVEDLVLERAYWDWRKTILPPEDTISTSSSSHSSRLDPVDATPMPTNRDSGVEAGESNGPSASNSTSSVSSTETGTRGPASDVTLCPNTPATATPTHANDAPKFTSPPRKTETLEHHDSPSPLTPSVTSPKKRCTQGNAPPCSATDLDKKRKRLFRIGLNILNKTPVKGIDFLVKHNFVDESACAIAKFLITRKGISRTALGEYFGCLDNERAVEVTREFMREIDLKNKEVDVALRHLMSHFHLVGESQKISHILELFQEVYVEQNAIRAAAQFHSLGTIMILCYGIVMLHTDLYNPCVRTKMTRDNFVNNLREVDDSHDIDRNLLLAIYDRIRAEEMVCLPDLTDQVRKIDEHLTGPLRPSKLVQPSRRLVCYCRLYEVKDLHKKERSGVAHQRDVFLFNDMVIVTKPVQKKRKEGYYYQVRKVIPLLNVQVFLFKTHYYPYGLEIKNVMDGETFVYLNTRTQADRDRFVEDLQECVTEVADMDRIRIEEELAKTKKHGQCGPSPNHPTSPGHFTGNHAGNGVAPAAPFKTNDCSPSSSQSHLSRPSSRNSNSSHQSLSSSQKASSTPRLQTQHQRRLSGDSGLVLDIDQKLT